MRVGVTGGAGYIGSHVVQDLLADGHQVTVIDDMSMGAPENIVSDHPAYRFIEADSTTESGIDALVAEKPEAVFHFAAFKAAGESMTHPFKYSANNIRGTFRLLERLVESGTRFFIFSSTAAVYGEPQYLPLDEKHPLQPINYYGFTKLTIERNLAWLSQLTGLRFAALRYFNAAGYDIHGRVRGLERKPNNLLPIIMEVAAGQRDKLEIFGRDYDTDDGTCVRDYIHVNDLSRGHLRAMESLANTNRDLIVNLGSGKGLSVQEVLDVAREVTGHPIPHVDGARRAGDPPRLLATADLADEILDWRCEHSDARTLVESTWQIYREL